MSQPHPSPVDPPMVPFALIGTGAWAAIGLVLLAVGAPAEWLRICLAGFLLGFLGVAVMAVHDRNRRRRRARTARRADVSSAPQNS